MCARSFPTNNMPVKRRRYPKQCCCCFFYRHHRSSTFRVCVCVRVTHTFPSRPLFSPVFLLLLLSFFIVAGRTSCFSIKCASAQLNSKISLLRTLQIVNAMRAINADHLAELFIFPSLLFLSKERSPNRSSSFVAIVSLWICSSFLYSSCISSRTSRDDVEATIVCVCARARAEVQERIFRTRRRCR